MSINQRFKKQCSKTLGMSHLCRESFKQFRYLDEARQCSSCRELKAEDSICSSERAKY